MQIKPPTKITKPKLENNALSSDNSSFFPRPLMHRESTCGRFFIFFFLNHNHKQTNNHSKRENQLTVQVVPENSQAQHLTPTYITSTYNKRLCIPVTLARPAVSGKTRLFNFIAWSTEHNSNPKHYFHCREEVDQYTLWQIVTSGVICLATLTAYLN